MSTIKGAEILSALGDVLSRCDRFCSRLDEFVESDHPRDGDGKFTSGGGSSAGPKTRLTPTEKSYISSYTGDDFLRVNRELREGKGSGPEVKNLDSAIEKSTLPAGTRLYRGMSREAARKLFNGAVISKGAVISDKAFLSTSRSKDMASFGYGIGGVLLEIETAEGQKGLDVSGLTRNPQEKEVLLPRNIKLRVLSINAPKSLTDPVIVKVAAA